MFTSSNPAGLLIVLHRNDNRRGKFVLNPTFFHHRRGEIEIHDLEDSFSINPEGSLWGFSGAQSGAVQNYNGRRIVASIDYVLNRFGSWVDVKKGIHIKGIDFGGTGALIQSIVLPKYQKYIAIVEARDGNMLLAKCCKNLVTSSWGNNRFNEVDFRLQMDKVKDIHFHWYRRTGNAAGQFDIEFFQLCEEYKVSC